eukprot:362450-Chlamydomonas_euryale.AAC.4
MHVDAWRDDGAAWNAQQTAAAPCPSIHMAPAANACGRTVKRRARKDAICAGVAAPAAARSTMLTRSARGGTRRIGMRRRCARRASSRPTAQEDPMRPVSAQPRGRRSLRTRHSVTSAAARQPLSFHPAPPCLDHPAPPPPPRAPVGPRARFPTTLRTRFGGRATPRRRARRGPPRGPPPVHTPTQKKAVGRRRSCRQASVVVGRCPQTRCT